MFGMAIGRWQWERTRSARESKGYDWLELGHAIDYAQRRNVTTRRGQGMLHSGGWAVAPLIGEHVHAHATLGAIANTRARQAGPAPRTLRLLGMVVSVGEPVEVVLSDLRSARRDLCEAHGSGGVGLMHKLSLNRKSTIWVKP